MSDPRIPLDRESGTVVVTTAPTAVMPLTDLSSLDHAVLIVKNDGPNDAYITWEMSHDGAVVDVRPEDERLCPSGRSVALPLDSDAMMVPFWGIAARAASGTASLRWVNRIRRLS